MTTEVSLPKTHYSITGYVILIIGLAGISAFLLFIWQGEQASWKITKYTAWTLWGCFFSFVLILAAAFYSLQSNQYKKDQAPYRPENVFRHSDTQKLQTISSVSHFPSIAEIRKAMRNLHGRSWQRKVNILLVTGKPDDVEKLTPGLTLQYWLQDSGTLLLWGGDLDCPADNRWLMALRQLRHRPADGMVWVTTGLSGYADAAGAGLPLTDDAMDSIALAIKDRNTLLGWQLPLYVWSLCEDNDSLAGRIKQPVGCLMPAGCRPEGLNALLQALIPGLITQGIQQICAQVQHNFLLTLAARLSHEPETVSGPLSIWLTPHSPLRLAGLVFSPPSPEAARSVKHHWGRDSRWDVLPGSPQALPVGLRPSQPGVNWRQVLAVSATVLMVFWGIGTVISFIANRNLITEVQEQVVQASTVKQPLSARLQALSELQKTLARLQYRAAHGAPWYLHAGLNQNNDLLAAIWPLYEQSALPLLRDAAAQHLEQQLNAFIRLPANSPQRDGIAKSAHDQLKLYLMLSHPERMDGAWFSAALMAHWPQRGAVAEGFWQATGPALLAHYGAALALHPQWKWNADEELVSQTRTLLVRQMGMRNSDASLYQKMLAHVSHQYADLRLADMTADTDASRLFTTVAVVPGMFTRKAWEEAIQPAIEKMIAGRREEMDWVLSDSTHSLQSQNSPEVLKKRLTERYFADFGDAWLAFLNSLRLSQVATLSEAIDQLTLMADVRQSPLVALMNTLNVQGRTGQTAVALTDSLVKSAKNLLVREAQPAIDQSAVIQGPLDITFGPILAMMDNRGAVNSNLSLQTFLTRITQVRLRLQQVTNAADPQAMTQMLAQTVFQGKAVDLTETRDYGSLIAAGLGQEWSGFGRTVFVRPMEQAWQQVLTPAADSLNAQWRAAVVDDWNSAFGGRYPFNNTRSDSSLPLLAKYLNADSGRIAHFLQTSLNGVLYRQGNRWVPDTIHAQGLSFNPEFLDAVNTLSLISDVAFNHGEARLHFDLRAGTAAGVMQTDMTIDNQKLVYVNQMPGWKRFSWPADTEASGASLSWISTQAGTRQYADIPGAWGWIRLLEEASVNAYPGMDSSYSLSWKAQDGRPLNYTLRTEAGSGPLVLLKLRNFRLPGNIFNVDTPRVQPSMTATHRQERY